MAREGEPAPPLDIEQSAKTNDAFKWSFLYSLNLLNAWRPGGVKSLIMTLQGGSRWTSGE